MDAQSASARASGSIAMGGPSGSVAALGVGLGVGRRPRAPEHDLVDALGSRPDQRRRLVLTVIDEVHATYIGQRRRARRGDELLDDRAFVLVEHDHAAVELVPDEQLADAARPGRGDQRIVVSRAQVLVVGRVFEREVGRAAVEVADAPWARYGVHVAVDRAAGGRPRRPRPRPRSTAPGRRSRCRRRSGRSADLARRRVRHVEPVQALIGIDHESLDVDDRRVPDLVAGDAHLAERARRPPAPQAAALVDDEQVRSATGEQARHADALAGAVADRDDIDGRTGLGIDAHHGLAVDHVGRVVRATHETGDVGPGRRRVDLVAGHFDGAVQVLETDDHPVAQSLDGVRIDLGRGGPVEIAQSQSQEALRLDRIGIEQVGRAEHLADLLVGSDKRRFAARHLLDRRLDLERVPVPEDDAEHGDDADERQHGHCPPAAVLALVGCRRDPSKRGPPARHEVLHSVDRAGEAVADRALRGDGTVLPWPMPRRRCCPRAGWATC